MTLGSPGGPTIVASVAQVIINVLDYKMDLKAAIELPRQRLNYPVFIIVRLRKSYVMIA